MLDINAGATVLVDPGIQLNITMQFLNVPPAPNNPAILMRVDYWDEPSKSYPPENAFVFYQMGSQVLSCSSGLPAARQETGCSMMSL